MEVGWGKLGKELCLTDLDTQIPRIPRIANDAEQVNAAELDKPEPAQCNSPNQPKACCVRTT